MGEIECRSAAWLKPSLNLIDALNDCLPNASLFKNCTFVRDKSDQKSLERIKNIVCRKLKCHQVEVPVLVPGVAFVAVRDPNSAQSEFELQRHQ